MKQTSYFKSLSNVELWAKCNKE